MSQAPCVVAVVVAHNPGDYFSDCLESIAQSNYPNLVTVVVDSSSEEVDTREVVEAILPDALYCRVSQEVGYSQACNDGAALVTEASHLLFLHDDVALAPEAISAMMEVAFSKNAGIVTPKVVLWDSPSQILQLGWDLDRTAAPSNRIDVGDRDQAQYDEVDEVTVAPGGSFLIRKDLFDALGGFDPSVHLFGEDVDLSWRTRLVGARIYTAPLARVRHKMISTLSPVRRRQQRRTLTEPNRERGGVDRATRLRYARRHQLRILIKNQVGFSRVRSLSYFVALAALEALYYLVTGRVRSALAIVEAVGWNLRDYRELRREAARVRSLQASGIGPPRFVSGSAKFSGYLATRRSVRRLQETVGEIVSKERTFSDVNGSDDASSVGALELFLSRATKVLLWFVGLLLVISLWDVLFGKAPLIGSFAPFPSLGTLFRSYFDGAGGSLLPGRSVAPPLDLILGLFGIVTLGFTGALQHLLLAAAIIGGAAGMYRVARRRSSPTAARLTTAVFLLLPLMSDLFVRGSYLMLLASTGLLPWLVLSFHRSLDAQRSSRRSKRRAYLGTGLFGALTLAVSPSVLLTFLLYGMAYAVMAMVRGSRDSSRRAALALGVVVVSSVALDLPWSLSLLNPSVGMARLFSATPPHGLSVLKLLEFSTGQGTGGSLVVVGFLVFVLLAMSFVRGIRVTILGSLVIGYSFFLLFAAVDTSGIFGGSPLPLAAPMAMMAILLSQAVGVSVDALTQDLPRYRLSFRHVLGAVGALTLLVGTVGTLRPLATARLGLPTAGFARSMSFVGSLPKNNSVLWLGDQSVLPVSGWKLTNGLSVALVSQAIPDVRSLYAPASYGDAAPLVRALRSAIAGNDVQLGSIFARYGVRYVVVPQPSTNPGFFVGTDLDLIFERQVDLRQLLVDPSVAAFEVTEPVRGYVGSTTLSSTALRYFGLAVQLASLLLVVAAFFRRRAWLIRVDLPQIRVSRRTSGGSAAQSRGGSGTSTSSRSFDEDSSLGAEVTVLAPHVEPSTDESDGTCAEPGSGLVGEVVEASRVERGRSDQSSGSTRGYNEVSDE